MSISQRFSPTGGTRIGETTVDETTDVREAVRSAVNQMPTSGSVSTFDVDTNLVAERQRRLRAQASGTSMSGFDPAAGTPADPLLGGVDEAAAETANAVVEGDPQRVADAMTGDVDVAARNAVEAVSTGDARQALDVAVTPGSTDQTLRESFRGAMQGDLGGTLSPFAGGAAGALRNVGRSLRNPGADLLEGEDEPGGNLPGLPTVGTVDVGGVLPMGDGGGGGGGGGGNINIPTPDLGGGGGGGINLDLPGTDGPLFGGAFSNLLGRLTGALSLLFIGAVLAIAALVVLD